MLKQSFAAVCGAIVLSLSLISCNAKDPQIAKPSGGEAWGLKEPKIISADGVEVKYGEANQKANLTFSVDDRLVMGNGSEAGVFLQYRTSCIRGGERFQIAASQDYKREYSLFAFLPAEIFYSPDARPLKDVNCTLEITAVNSHGSRQTFPALNLPMVDGGSAKLDLFLNAKKVSAEKVDSLFYTQLQDVELPSITSDEKLSLYCASFVKESTDKYVRNISDLKIVKGQVRGNESRAQYCRVIKTTGNTTLSVSPFFKIQFFNTDKLISNLDSPDSIEKGGFSLNKGTDFLGFRITNTNNETLHMVWPKNIAASIIVSGMMGTAKLETSLIPTIDGATFEVANNSAKIKIAPKTQVTIRYVLSTAIICEQSLGVVRFEAEVNNKTDLSLEITDSSFSDIWGDISVAALQTKKVLIGDQGRAIRAEDKSNLCYPLNR